MTTILNSFLAFITQHSELAYGVIFLISFSESLALIGLVVPGTVLMVGAVSARLAVVVSILVASIWIFIWVCSRMVAMFTRKAPACLFALRQWSTAQKPTNGFVRPVKRFFLFLLFRGYGEVWLVASLTIVLFIAGWGFLGVLQDVLAKDPLVLADQAVYHFFQSLRTTWGDSAFVTITELGDSFVNLSLACALLMVLLAKRRFRTAWFWTLTVLGGLLMVQLLKWVIHLPRSVEIYHGASAYGFPSGHATMSVIVYGFIAILLARRLSGTW